MGETPVLSQCDSCDKWFHPNCVNAFLVSQSASKSIESFHCPICLHMIGRPSNYAYKPNSEWKFNPQINSSHKNMNKISNKNGSIEVVKSNQKDTINSVGKKDTTGTSIVGVVKGKGVSKGKEIGKGNGKGKNKIVHPNSSDPLTLMDLKKALEWGSELRISQVSVICAVPCGY